MASLGLSAKEGEWSVIILPSGEMRRVKSKCRATIGQLGNLDWINVSIGKAGRSRHMGIRPHTRAKAMNPIDHPLGGGEGRSQRRPPSGEQDRRAGQGRHHPQPAQEQREADPPPPQVRQVPAAAADGECVRSSCQLSVASCLERQSAYLTTDNWTTDNWTMTMSRSAKKGPYVDEKLFKKVSKLNENRAKQPDQDLGPGLHDHPGVRGHTFEVHNGNKFLRVFVQEDMVGHKLGEFSPDAHVPRSQRCKKADAPASEVTRRGCSSCETISEKLGTRYSRT